MLKFTKATKKKITFIKTLHRKTKYKVKLKHCIILLKDDEVA